MSTTTPEYVVVLDQPIVRGETTIEQVTLRKPNAGEQRMTQAETALLEGFQHLLATTEVAARL